MKLKQIQYYIKFTLVIIFILLCGGISAKNNSSKFTVVIDAGHGGNDTGAVDNNAKEKDINLKVSLYLAELIEKKLKDVKVVMTRKDDTYLTLQQRADKANKSKGDLFISIHTNSVDINNKNRKNVSGSSVYALGLHKDENNMQVARRENSVIEYENDYEQKYSGFDPSKDESYIIFEMAQKKNLSNSIKFAETVQKELVSKGRNNRGVHQAGFWVLWATSMPAVLVELDFICNPESASYMTSDKGAKELAEAIFTAFEKYYKTWQKSTAAVNVSPSDFADIQTEDDLFVENNDILSEVEGASSQKDKAPVHLKPQNNNDNNNKARKRRSQRSKNKSEERDFSNPLMAANNYGKRNRTSTEVLLAYDDKEDVTQVKEKPKSEPKGKKEKEKKKNGHKAKREKIVTVYKIQLHASEKLLKKTDPAFYGLEPISIYKENNKYKYFYGESDNKEDLTGDLEKVRKNIPGATIVAVKKSQN